MTASQSTWKVAGPQKSKERKQKSPPVEEASIPEERLHKTQMCHFITKKGQCHNGSRCTYAHHESELKIQPNSRLCKTFSSTGQCPHGEQCTFAHSRSELTSQFCKNECSREGCSRGSFCDFKHTTDNLNIPQSKRSSTHSVALEKGLSSVIIRHTPTTNSAVALPIRPPSASNFSVSIVPSISCPRPGEEDVLPQPCPSSPVLTLPDYGIAFFSQGRPNQRLEQFASEFTANYHSLFGNLADNEPCFSRKFQLCASIDTNQTTYKLILSHVLWGTRARFEDFRRVAKSPSPFGFYYNLSAHCIFSNLNYLKQKCSPEDCFYCCDCSFSFPLESVLGTVSVDGIELTLTTNSPHREILVVPKIHIDARQMISKTNLVLGACKLVEEFCLPYYSAFGSDDSALDLDGENPIERIFINFGQWNGSNNHAVFHFVFSPKAVNVLQHCYSQLSGCVEEVIDPAMEDWRSFMLNSTLNMENWHI
ncbi:hypothetical protein P9112_002387 [Eukaryota sp. TZLM1-RC]